MLGQRGGSQNHFVQTKNMSHANKNVSNKKLTSECTTVGVLLK
jgi:hypothetical protein